MSRDKVNTIHFYCHAVEAGFYIDVVQCLPVDPATRVCFPAGFLFTLPHRGSSTLFQEKPVQTK